MAEPPVGGAGGRGTGATAPASVPRSTFVGMSIPTAFVRYVDCWLAQEPSVLPEVLAPGVHYVESNGPAYHGLAQVQRWFADWHARGRVLAWELGDSVSGDLAHGDSVPGDLVSGDLVHAVRWRFTCRYDGVQSTFDGVTWVVLDDVGRIVELREFAATLPLSYPYD